MSDEHQHKEPFCMYCMAEEVAGGVLADFTEARPRVKMSYTDWMFLGALIEMKIMKALGGMPKEDEEVAEHTVQ